MTEPAAVATGIEEVCPGVLHWRISDERIGGHTSAAHAAMTNEGAVLIDPLPLPAAELDRLAPVTAICLTAQCHQRCAWRYRRRFGAPVYGPVTRPMEEAPDELYAAGDRLPGGLVAIHTPGPEQAHFSFLLDGDPGVLFCSDLLMVDEGRLHFVPFEYHDDPDATRGSAEALLNLPFTVLCLDHGTPIREGAKDALRELLASSG